MAKGVIGVPRLDPGGKNLQQVLSKIVEIIEQGEGQRGDPLNAKVTWADLREASLVDFAGIVRNRPLASQVIAPDPLGAAPTKPTNFTATPTYTAVVLEWDPAAYEGHRHTEVWRSETNDLGTAIRIGQAPHSIFSDVVGHAKTYYYWIRFIGTGSANTGPFSDVAEATTSLSVEDLLVALTGQINTSQLSTSLNTRLDQIDKPDLPGSLTARLAHEITERVSEQAAIVNEYTQMIAQANSNFAAQISATNEAWANADEALASEFKQLVAIPPEEDGETVWSLLQRESQARTTGIQAVASDVSTLQAQNSTQSAQIQTLSEVSATKNEVNAIYEVKTDVAGNVAGYGLVNSGDTSQFFINADTFAILPQNGAHSVRNVSTGAVSVHMESGRPLRLRQWTKNTAVLSRFGQQTIGGVSMSGDVIAPFILRGSQILYACIDSGTTGDTEPAWGALEVVDGSTKWRRIDNLRGPMVPFVVDNNRVVIDNGFIRELTADNIKAGSIGADKISSVNLSAVNGNVGELTAGVLRSGNSRFVINLTDGFLAVYDAQGNERVRLGRLS